MKLYIHDLSEEQFSAVFPDMQKDSIIISNNGKISRCMGCFGCWIKTPGQCIIKDEYQHMGELIAKSNKVNIISRCCYGGYSPFIKNILDRSISYLHPFFTFRNKEIHHKSRYSEKIDLKVYFYGEDITKEEMNTARNLVKANGINMNVNSAEVQFISSLKELKEVRL